MKINTKKILLMLSLLASFNFYSMDKLKNVGEFIWKVATFQADHPEIAKLRQDHDDKVLDFKYMIDDFVEHANINNNQDVLNCFCIYDEGDKKCDNVEASLLNKCNLSLFFKIGNYSVIRYSQSEVIKLYSAKEQEKILGEKGSGLWSYNASYWAAALSVVTGLGTAYVAYKDPSNLKAIGVGAGATAALAGTSKVLGIDANSEANKNKKDYDYMNVDSINQRITSNQDINRIVRSRSNEFENNGNRQNFSPNLRYQDQTVWDEIKDGNE